MHIREATEKDAAAIALLARITFDEAFGFLFRNRKELLSYFDTTFSVEKIKSSIRKKSNVFWIAFVDDLPVGYAKLKLHSSNDFIEDKNTAQLQKIYVLKDFLAQRIGHHLQALLLQKAKESGAKSIWLSALHSNQRALNFYLKNNFKEVGAHTFSIGQENFLFKVMYKPL